MECKLTPMPNFFKSFLELIDTLWNVNEEIEGL